jgi:hypothetical protein
LTYSETTRHHHYVTARDETGKAQILLGPFADRATAEAHEPLARAHVRSLPFGVFVLIGTARFHIHTDTMPPCGALNDRLGL